MSVKPSAATASPERREAAQRLLEQHRDRIVGFGVLLAVRKRQPWHRDEFVSAAIEGFWRAALVYDPERNDDVFGFAVRRMTGAVIDWMRTREEVATRTRREREARGEYVPRRVPMPAVEVGGEDVEYEVVDPSASDPSDAIVDAEAAERVLSLFDDPRQREVIRLVYVLGLPFKTAGLIVGVSESRVSQIVKVATAKARPAMLRLVGAA